MNKQIQKKPVATRYRSLILSIIIFLLLIMAILGLNLYSSFQINKDTVAISASTKMQDTIQQINKDLFNLKLSYGEDVFSQNIDSSIKRIKTNTEFFDKALDVLQQGGSISVNGVDSSISAVNLNTAEANAALIEVSSEWSNFKKDITQFTNDAQNVSSTQTGLDLAVNKAQGSGVIIYNDMAQVVSDIKQTASSRANLLKLVQLVGIGAIILYFLVFIFFFLKRLRESDAVAESARQETDDILNTVNSGLFLLDKDLNIGNQHSKQLNTILLKQDLGGKKLSNLLEGIVSQQDMEVTGDFIEQLYNPRVKTKLINDLNPLRKIQALLKDGTDEVEKYLDFNFERITRDDKISHILVSVNDITNAVYLEKRLEDERRQNEEQSQMIASILNTEPSQLNEFVSNAQTKTNRINNVLKDSKKGTNVLVNKLTEIFREAHSLKGDASALNFSFLATRITDFEEVIKELKDRQNLSGDDFLPLTIRLDEIIGQVQSISLLSARLSNSGLQTSSSQANSSQTKLTDKLPQTKPAQKDSALVSKQEHVPNDELELLNASLAINNMPAVSEQAASPIQQAQPEMPTTNTAPVQQSSYYHNFVQQLAERNGKKVKLDAKNTDLLEKGTSDKHSKLKEVALQLLRNALTHGIETPTVRLGNFKPEVGTVSLVFEETADTLTLMVQDDGAGINYQAIRDKAIATGLGSAQEVATWQNRKLLGLIFDSSFSTANSVTDDAGQGVGLDLVKVRAKELGAKMKVDTDLGKFTRFTLTCKR